MSDVLSANTFKTGLVLSGGGAKGAYQVGVLKALVELDARVDVVAGASMGALNGAVLACAPTLSEGVDRLETLWNTLAEESPVEANVPAYFKLLAMAGLTLGTPLSGVFARIPSLIRSLGQVAGAADSTARIANWFSWLDTALMSEGPLKALMDEYLDIKGLMCGMPLYISVYESQGGLVDVLRCAAAEVGFVNTPPSRFVHVQSLPETVRRDALLASAAIPLLYQARQIGDSRYSDGGQGGWQTAQGNTPITPLIEAGCEQVIVTHLTDGSLWSRHDFPDTTVLEVRPQSAISRSGSPLDAAKAALGFDASNIARLMDQGYRDALFCVGRVMQASGVRQALRRSESVRDDSLSQGSTADAALAEAMLRLR